MGNASSKAASAAPKAAAAVGRRQYPSSPSILNSATSTSPYPSSQSQSSPQPQQYHGAPSAAAAASATAAAATAPLSPSAAPTPSPSQVHPNPQQSPPSDTKAAHIDLDGRDPHFASSLRRLGPAVAVNDALPNQQSFPTSSQPPLGQQGQNIFPTSSPTPASPSHDYHQPHPPANPAGNPSWKVVQARERINAEFATQSENLGRGSFTGRTLISARDISDVLRMSTQQGKSDAEIEKQLRLKPGLVRELVGARGLVDNV